MKYNSVSFKQSHNSYDRDEDVQQSLTFHPDSVATAGCRGLEYDISRHSDSSGGTSRGYFTVAHRAGAGEPFATYLGAMRSWHLAQPGHDVVLVTVDIKSKRGSKEKFPGEIDAYMRQWFDESILFTPRQLSPDSDDFVAHVENSGWPDVDALRGKLIICLSGNEDWKSYYAKTDPRSRLCFADTDFDDDKEVELPRSGQRIFYSSNLYSRNVDTWRRSVAKLRAANLIARGYVLNGESIWNHARDARLNILATDKITGHSWAHVGKSAFVVL